jgi:hypothetical protein
MSDEEKEKTVDEKTVKQGSEFRIKLAMKTEEEQKKEFLEQYALAKLLEKEQKLEMSVLGFVKELTINALIVREVETPSYEAPRRTIFYLLPLTYKIDAKAKEQFLKIEKSKDPSDKFEIEYSRVLLRNVDSGSCQLCPLPNSLFDPSSFPYLEITKGKARRLKRSELKGILQSGQVLGIFSFDLQNRILRLD